MGVKLFDYQLGAIKRMKNGSILCGGVGSGKSLTALAYYYMENGGSWRTLLGGPYKPMSDVDIRDLYIITTARKRDTFEWEAELTKFLMYPKNEVSLYSNNIVIDSWNNIKKYDKIHGAFFIFDEQRLIGSGAWVKAFYKIAKKNKWILLSATPGDTWKDYIPVFVANGFYRNKTQFMDEHAVYNRYSKYPKIDRFTNTKKLNRYRNDILVTMDYERKTKRHHVHLEVEYPKDIYKDVTKRRWNIYEDKPIENISELCYIWRKVTNTDDSRQKVVLEILEDHSKVIIFYNFNYELEILRNLYYGDGVTIAEWNGHKHESIPTTDKWVYLVQYTAGSEGWNCVETDTIIFFSQNYSYRTMKQAAGRIDRLNTPFEDLYYYHLKSKSPIDLGIERALKNKKNFNETRYVKW